jgi:predicted nucleotidyltransferase
MNVAELPMAIDCERVAEFCRARGIRRLRLFGSVLLDDFDPERSDVDAVVEFSAEIRPGFRFFGYGEELGDLIGRKVDLLTPAMLSPHFRDEVLSEAVTVYEQA